MTALTFPGEVSIPGAPVGGCELGGNRCVRPAEVQVTLPENGAERLLCRDHVGWYLLGATGEFSASVVLVRHMGPESVAERGRPGSA